MRKVNKFLLGIFGGQVVLLLFFGAFEFEKVIVALYGGMWVGIGIAVFLLRYANPHWYTEVLAGIFGVQAVVFIGLDLARASPGMVESSGFLAIGVWIGVLIGMLLNTLDEMEKRLAGVESPEVKSEDDQA
ncbi:MAG: alkaline shock response membrane anchor protein AmaP [Methylohalobius sp.]|nr:alkaline shock response membrane anchor protein AmaP [Methylohalobius sp.]